MQTPSRSLLADASAWCLDADRRDEAEAFIRAIFAEHYGAHVPAFAPNLVTLSRGGRIQAAAGWRGADEQALYLEQYLDAPVEARIAQLAGQLVPRARIAEVGHLAAARPGAGGAMILALAGLLHEQGYDWVVFTATEALLGIFAKMGLPPLALAPADPRRLGASAAQWGRYYDTRPVVVAGPIQLGLDRLAGLREEAAYA